MDLSCSRVCFISLILLVCLTILLFNYSSLKTVKKTIDQQLSRQFYNRFDVYNPAVSTGPDLVVRSVFFDKRSRYGHSNATVFLIEVRKHYLEANAGLITACQVGTVISKNLLIHPIYINGKVGKIIDEAPSLTHAMALIDCFDVPASNQSTAAILYRTSTNSFVIPAKSERPLLVPYRAQVKANASIAVCVAVLYSPTKYLHEWLDYQKLIGVAHVHIIASDTFVSAGGLELEYVKNGLSTGYVSIDVWKTWLRTTIEIHYHSQMLAYHDCIYRYQGVFDYVLFTDTDDYFTPVSSKGRLALFPHSICPSGACVFDWVEYYPDCGLEPSENSNLTARLRSKAFTSLPYKKTMYRLEDTIEVGIHDPREMMPDTGGVPVPKSLAYVAHLRMQRIPPNGCHH